MIGALFFWRQPLRIAGPDSPADAIARLQAELSAGRFGLRERLAGQASGTRLRVRKFSLLGRALDIVEFEGEAGYAPATVIQFIGMLAIGAGMTGLGLMRALAGSGWELLGAGGVVTAIAIAWILSSYSMKGEQVEFIESRLRGAVDRSRATPA
jgi:hypothetical protein